MADSYINEGMTAVTPYLFVEKAAEAIDFYVENFGAEEVTRLEGPGGSVMHAEIAIGGARIMLSDANPDWGTVSPKDLDGRSSSTFIYVPDVDAVMKKAEGNGATIVEGPEDMFWGDRHGRIMDPFGHMWGIATHVEDVSSEELQKRTEAFMKEMAEAGG